MKSMLQVELPPALRARIVDSLFRKYVTTDECGFASELYVTRDQLLCMRRHGMFVGSHGYDHLWMGRLPADEQARELDRALGFLWDVGGDPDGWAMCYPYGDHDASLVAQLQARGCAVAFTTEVGLPMRGHDPLLLPRLDTNDLPKDRHAEPGAWTMAVA